MDTEKLIALYQSAEMVQRNYAGQLSEEFQQYLAEAHSGASREDCIFYHSVEDGRHLHSGFWDLRGREKDYIGLVEPKGCRLLEFGPASGYLTFYLEREGAQVVAFELPPGKAPDLVPLHSVDLEAHRKSGIEFQSRIRNSWWYLRRMLGGTAAVVYGDIYELPPDLGRFNVATFGSILLHLSNPFRALHAASQITDDAIIVTEVLQRVSYLPGQAIIEFHPEMRPDLVNWWALTPVAVERMLQVLGFPHTECWFHFQRRKDPDKWVDVPSFTVVGRRAEHKPPGSEVGPDQKRRQQELEATWERKMERELETTRAALMAIQNSTSWRLTKGLRTVADFLKRRNP